MNPFEFPENILRYSENHTSEEEKVLADNYRTAHLKTVHPHMLSGRVQGKFLSFISQMIQPGRILEVGTFTGYSAYCLTKGLRKGGKITTIEINEELEDLVRDFFLKAGINDKVELIIGDALKIIPAIEEPFDLIFLDANKEHYPDYYEICISQLNPGGYLIADNVLWGGKVAVEPHDDHSSARLHQFNTMVQNDPRVENVFLTVRDGLMIVRKNNIV